MNRYTNFPQCPLCPHIVQYNIQQLINHLCMSHSMKNSACILARIMISSPMGYQEVVEVLKDVGNLRKKRVSVEEQWRCQVKELEHKNKELECKNKGAANLSFGWDFLALKSTILPQLGSNFRFREHLDAYNGL
jgi:hypothetical protein